MLTDRSLICIGPEQSLREAIALIDRNERGIVLVVDSSFRLLDTITDGDVRRAILQGVDLSTSIRDLAGRRAGSPYPTPVCARAGTDAATLLRLLQESQLRHLPIVDDEECVVGLVTLSDLLPSSGLPVRALVMAGGAGTRLRPLTDQTPKPMLPVGDRPLLERIIGRLRSAGVRQVSLATHYRPEKIVEHFGDGAAFGVDLSYVHEDEPLGTAGALALLSVPDEPLLVVNGDILTEVDFAAMLAFHQEHAAQMTVAVRHYSVQVPYGVIECSGPLVQAVREKPELGFFVNAGMYLVEPAVCAEIPPGVRLDMPDLIQQLLQQGRTVVSFPVREYWLDVGKHDDYLRAQQDASSGKVAT